MIANVDADKYKDLGEKYGVSGFPTLKFFPKTNKAGEDYDGGCDLDAFVAFINEKSNTNCDGQGRLTSLVGKVDNMDDLVHELSNVGVHEHEAILAKFEAVFERLAGPYASYGKIYLKATKKITEKGEDYAKNEVE